MIGQRILDRIDEHLDAPEPPRYHGLKPPTLRIVTSSIPDMKAALGERTNTVQPPKDYLTPNLSYTPNTCHTFGRPNPTTILPSPTGGSSRDRRERRYSVAEQALADALRSPSSQRSPQELQIQALEQATALLSAHAHDSRDRVAKLRLCLADREVDPASYSALQQERWMMEKRQSAVDSEVKELTQQLASLKVDRNRSQDSENIVLTKTIDNEAKRRANLARFLQYSPTRTSFSIGHKPTPLPDYSTFSRRMTISDVSPIRLRPSTVVSPMRRFSSVHSRRASLDGERSISAIRSRKPWTPTSNGRAPRSPLTMVAENGTRAASNRRPAPLSSRISSTPSNHGSDDLVSTRPSTPPLSITSETSSSSAQAVGDNGGVATIYERAQPRPRAEILANLRDDDVRIPEYALDLLGDFDLIHDDISLSERDLSSKYKEVLPSTLPAIPEPSEESYTGPYTSFALPPFEMTPPLSHISLSSPPSTPAYRSKVLPQSGDSSPPSRSSTPTTSKAQSSSPARHSLLFYMRKGRSGDSSPSPASSATRIDGNSTRGPKRRFALFSRK
ncbi:hypothetical protein BV22DRAFT_1059738 [Leucogyrophana mollusca]|uniref:Uncharacterized protein n=1 Tax=Leucogyrophana mollusca TaxID=85980 RepID=A0ACB8BS78_9AGAM|nr:hypothetical protein BV22DRAFT_1059738 [Leucogyrophana mollusca]